MPGPVWAVVVTSDEVRRRCAREQRRLAACPVRWYVAGAPPKIGHLVFMLITPPVEPRPNMNDDGPFSTSTLSTAKLSRVYQPGSRTPSRKMSLRASNPRM